MNVVAKWSLKTALGILALFGVLFIALIIYYWPVIDRVAMRPCHYYPNAFADCK